VYIHQFFPSRDTVSDTELLPLIEQTLDKKNAREWYWALMDYGSHLKSLGIKTHRRSLQYVKQSKFEGSKRQIRGAVLKLLVSNPKTVSQLYKAIDRTKEEIDLVLRDLAEEGLVTKKTKKYSI
jgi:A/G-specific adenine glycosylase